MTTDEAEMGKNEDYKKGLFAKGADSKSDAHRPDLQSWNMGFEEGKRKTLEEVENRKMKKEVQDDRI